ncbi:MAG TPA: PQQ-binding-like beta-propeller repeat protein [Acetobacteraceae bacterium]|nr:PQQ-binding-like beta-propeller repeat protein [Acetobacteraceae bacterium]
MRLPRLLPLLLALFACAALAFAVPGAARAEGLAFVMNSGAASISVIDMSTHKELRRIPVLREPHHWALSPDGHSLIIGDSSGNTLFFLDPTTGAVQRRVLVADPYQLGFSPNGKYFVVNGLARNQIDVYAADSMKLLHRFPIRAMPSHLAYSPGSHRVFVTLQETNRMVAIDLSTMRVLWDRPVGNTPAGVLWQNGKLLVCDMGTDYVAEVDPADGRVIGHIVTDRGAHNLFRSPDGKTIWVNNRVSGTTTVLDAGSLRPLHTYHIPGGPDDLFFAPDGKVWITRRFAESVAVLDPATGHFTTIDVGRSPHGIFLNPRAPSPDRLASAR